MKTGIFKLKKIFLFRFFKCDCEIRFKNKITFFGMVHLQFYNLRELLLRHYNCLSGTPLRNLAPETLDRVEP
jgi:hypothetical protein